MIGLRRPPPDDGSGVFACCLFVCVFVVGMRARAGDAQMNTVHGCDIKCLHVQVPQVHVPSRLRGRLVTCAALKPLAL